MLIKKLFGRENHDYSLAVKSVIYTMVPIVKVLFYIFSDKPITHRGGLTEQRERDYR